MTKHILTFVTALMIVWSVSIASAQGETNSPPNAAYSWSCSSLTCSFDGSISSDPDGTIVSYLWDFGDGSPTSSAVTVDHSFPTSGTYTVTLTVTDNYGEASSVQATFAVVNSPPSAAYAWSCSSLTCSFDGSISSDLDGTIVSYLWDFGDGSPTSSAVTVDHSFPTSGTYTVMLTVTDNYGEASSVQATFSVVNSPPSAAYSWSCSSLTCSFDGSISSDPDGTIVSYLWDFGDGSPTSSAVTVDHSFPTSGTYTVTLTVTDNYGEASSVQAAVSVVSPAPTLTVQTEIVTVNEGQLAENEGTVSNSDNDAVSLYPSVGSLSQPETALWVWSYTPDDGPTDSQTVTIQAVDSDGNSTEVSFTLQVINLAPTATFANTSGNLFEGEPATLTFSNPQDASSADSTAGYIYAYDCTNDGVFELDETSMMSFDCFYPQAMTYTAHGRIKDKDGGQTDYFVSVTMLSPEQAASEIIQTVNQLAVNGLLNGGQSNSLVQMLNNITENLNKGNSGAAMNQLNAFINHVQSLVETGELSSEWGQILIDLANRMILSLE